MPEIPIPSIIPSAPWRRQVGRVLIFATFLLLFLPSPPKAQASHRRVWGEYGGGRTPGCPAPPGRSFPGGYLGEHYSPEENLEAIDVAMIDRAKKTIDIAMYAFTDRAIADALIRAARRGVRIRIYRDRIQVRDRGDKTRRLLESRAGREHITVRVKRNSSRNIMHLKAYLIDASLLRTGSANWSPPGEGAFGCRRHPLTCHQGRWQQDNNLFLSNDRKLAEEFGRTFNHLWNRSSNLRDPRATLERLRRRRHHERDGSRY